ncbi:hypothetical protein C6341_g9324 [Phytophthora cactorum]|nr:hypothetical protein C6341_g9324 [Phytophthora cactorum]
MEAGEGANASLPSAESNGEDLFRLLKFVRETQCEMEVVKPVLDELEVMRMCRSFGMMSSVNPKDFDFNVLHAREFDDDFVRFLRFELFENACPGDVKLKGLFGKQAQVADALVDLKACSIGTVASLAGATDGIYCVKINPESNEGQSNGEKNVAGLVVFSWIRDELFEPKELRDTPAFVLRFLTGLTPDIICSTSPSDLEQVATAMTTSDEQEDDELSSYSVSFHIEKQEDQPDSSSCVAVSSVDLEALPEDCSNICLLKGSYPAIAVTRTMNSVIRPKQFRRIFHSHMQLSFAEWLKAESQHCRIDLNPVIVRSAKLCQNILKAFDMWPEDEMNAAWEAQEKKEQQDYALAAQQLKEEIANQRAIVDQVSNELFQLRGSDTANPALITSLQTALSVYESFREWIRSTCLRKIDRNIQLTLDAPNCLRKVEAKLFAVYSCGDVGELGKLLEMCATTPRPDLVKAVNNRKAKTPKPEVTVEASETTWKSFMEKVSEPLIKLRTKWWIAVESVLAATNEVEPKKLKSKHKTAWYDHVRPIIESKFEQLRQFLLSKDGLLITVSACPRGRGNVYCEGTKEVYAPPSVCQDIVKLNMQVGKTKSATGRQELLGQHLVAPGENYVAMFTVKVRSAVKICTGKERMCVKFIYFPPSTDSRRPSRANEKVIRTLGKFASLCDYDARNRIMTFLSEDSVGIYKFDESFRKMERMKVVDLGVRSTLAELPFRDVLLLDSTVYVTDSSGCSQGIDIHNDQTSNVMNVHDETSLSCSRLLELADNLAIGVVSRVASDDGAFEGVLKCISRDDNRHLPDLRLGVKFLTDRVNVQCVDDGVLVLDPLAQKVYFFSVRVTVRSDSYRMRQSDNGGSKASESDSSNADCPRKQHWMYAFYHVFEKFPVRGLLDVGVPSPVSILVACSGVEETNAALENYHDFLSLLMSDLMALNKPLHGLDLTSGLKVQRSLAGVTMKSKPLKSLFQTLITFLPVQICRAEGNALTVLHDGMDQSLEPEDEFQAWGAADIAESIRFGLLSPLLCAWRGRCVVITSMGKQSTGKSYFLNHLTGSSFAIAGNRCTDGAWMTLRIMQDVLLVVLDFEGLGSFERTDQEDVFLSVLNASLSMFTIFRMEMRFDKDIDGLFTKFQKGINLLKNDERLFQGTLYMSVKDVNPNDRHGILSEFQRKFQKLLTVNRDRNFLTEMYSGKLKINCSPPLGTLGYYDSLRHARQLIETLVNDPDLSSRGFKSGSSYHDCIRLVLAKISILDWTAVDESSQRLEMNELHRKLPGAIRTGCLIPAEAQTKNESLPRSLKDPLLHDKSLLCMLGLGQLSRDYPEFSECWAIVNQEVTLDEMDDEDVDFGPSACFQANAGTSSIHFTLQNLFQRYLALTAKGPLEKIMGKDYANFDAIVSFLVCRRKTKVILWPIGHEGEHSAAHGNMRNMHFVAEDDVINWEDRKYVPGEKGVAEMCNMHCSSAGRGHVHYSKCDKETSSACVYTGLQDQRRHCMNELKPRPEHQVDELLHEKYWKTIGWEDPCRSAVERALFTKCPYLCDTAEHNGEGKSPSYCDLEAWHLPAATPSIAERRGFSYVSGHRFACSHASTTGKVHHVFVLDCSGSMRGDPWEELVSGVRGYLQSRLAAGVKQDIVSVVTFGNQGIIEFEGVPIRTAPNRSIDFHGGGTFYSNGLNQANAIFSRTNLSVYKPVMIFFTDGRPADRKKGPALAVDVRNRFAKFGLRTFVVGYGRASDMGLEDLAEKLGGSVHEALTTADLREAFRSISVSLGARAGLIHTTTAA